MKFQTRHALTPEVAERFEHEAAELGELMEGATRALAALWDQYEKLHTEARRYGAEGRVAIATGLYSARPHFAGFLGAPSRAAAAVENLDKFRRSLANPRPAPLTIEGPMSAAEYKRRKEADPSWLWGGRNPVGRARFAGQG